MTSITKQASDTLSRAVSLDTLSRAVSSDPETTLECLEVLQAKHYMAYREYCIILLKYIGPTRIHHLTSLLYSSNRQSWVRKPVVIDDFTKSRICNTLADEYLDNSPSDALYFKAKAFTINQNINEMINESSLIEMIASMTSVKFDEACIKAVCRCRDNKIALILLESYFVKYPLPNLDFWRKLNSIMRLKNLAPDIFNYKFILPPALVQHHYTFRDIYAHVLYNVPLPEKYLYEDLDRYAAFGC